MQTTIKTNTMRNNVLLIAFMLLTAASFAQKHDNIWLGGSNLFPGAEGNGNYLIRFDNGQPVVESAALNLNFEATTAAFADSSGQLYMYTNGCSIMYRTGEMLVNGDGMNPGTIRDLSCNEFGYISSRGAVFIPFPGREGELWYLLYMSVDQTLNRGFTYGPLRYSLITRYSAQGIPRVLDDEVMLDVSYAQVLNSVTYEPFSVVRHGNGRDWWIVTPEYRRNIYHSFLLGGDNYKEEMPDQTIGPNMKCKRIGATLFSDDGTKFARQQNCGVTVMDFNRCTGKFSNPVYLPLPAEGFYSGGLVFSDDNTKLLTCSQLCIYTANLNDPIPAFDTLISTTEIAGTSLQYMQKGPDGNVYFSTLQRVNRIPVLRDPFGSAPEFDPEGLVLPVQNIRSLPQFPNYRLLDLPGSPCDTLGISPVTEAWVGATPQIRPNPAQDILYLDLSTPEHVTSVQLTDALGRVVYSSDQWRPSISVVHLPEGVYYLMIRQARGAVFSEKVVVRR